MNYALIGFLFIVSLVVACVLAWKYLAPKLIPKLKNLFRRKNEEEKAEPEVKPPREGITIDISDKEREYMTKLTQMEERLRQMTERAKKVEEAYDELKAEYDKLKKEKEEIEQKLKEKDEEIDKILKESNKLVRWFARRFNKGEYVPLVMWTKRGNAMVLKFVCGVAYINGGWRALLVDRLTDRPEKGEWYPPLDKPGAMFIFRDQPGFNPDDPQHTVLFDVNLHDWMEDLKISKADPHAKPVAFVAGVDEDGNPVHRLEFGAPLDIRRLRAENRKLKTVVGTLRYRISKLEEELWNVRHELQVERDRREHYERENKLLKAKLAEMEEVLAIQMDETEILRQYARSMKRREYAFKKRYKDLEDEYLSDLITPTLKGIPGYEYLEKLGREKCMQIFAKLYPIALAEAKVYGIDTDGKNMQEVVTEWLKAKFDRENKDIVAVLEDLRMLDEVAELLGK